MTADPLESLRAYRRLAPWNLRDLAGSASAILRHAGVRPTNAAAAHATSERTIRFYISRGVVSSPTGHGTAATYSYRHLLQVLAVKLRQMEGATLETITRELAQMTGDVLERRVAAALGPRLPVPQVLDVAGSGRAYHASRDAPDPARHPSAGFWRRIAIGPGAELHLRNEHPLANQSQRDDEVAEAVRAALERLGTRSADRD